MTARIYKPSTAATQSGPGDDFWLLTFEPLEPRKIDPLMGWTGSGDTTSQVTLRFDTLEAAQAYARRHGVVATVAKPSARKFNVRAQGYGGNFAHTRRGAWTH